MSHGHVVPAVMGVILIAAAMSVLYFAWVALWCAKNATPLLFRSI